MQRSSEVQNTLRTGYVMLTVAIVLLVFNMYTAILDPAWQQSTMAGATVIFLILSVLSVRVTHRGKIIAGTWLNIGAILGLVLVGTFLYSNLGLLFATIAVFFNTMIAAQTEKVQTGPVILLSAAVGLSALLLDFFALLKWRIPAIHTTALWIIIGSAALIYGIHVLRRLPSYSMRSKMTISFVAVVLLAVIPITYLNNNASRRVLTEEANQRLLASANRTAYDIDAFVSNNLENVRSQALLPVLAEYLRMDPEDRAGSDVEKQVEAILNTLIQTDQGTVASYAAYVTSYGLIDAEGRDVIDTNAQDIGTDKSDRDYFTIPMRSGATYVSDVRFSPTIKSASLFFSSPVRDTNGQTIGVLRARYSASVLQRLIKQAGDLAGEDMHAILLDEYHIRLAHSTAPNLIFRSVAPLEPELRAQLEQEGRLPQRPPEAQSTNLPAFDQKLSNFDTTPFFSTETHLTQPEEGHLEQVAVAPTSTRPWLVAFAQSQDTFLAPVSTQTRNTILLTLGIVGLVAAISTGLSQLLSYPITRLTKVAETVAQGDLTVQATIDSEDEIGQLAKTFNSMTAQLRQTLAGLEKRIEERTQDLERRSSYLEASAEVSQAATSILDTEQLIQEVVRLIRQRFDLYYVGLFLTDETGTNAVLHAGTGEAGQRMLARQHQVKIGAGMIGWSIAHGEARIALDVGEDAVRLTTAELPETRSEAALPLRVRGQVLGALTVQSDEPAAFDEDIIVVLQTMADQIAVALDNARLFTESQEAVSAVRRAYGDLSRADWTQLLRSQADIGYRSNRLGTSKADIWRPEMEQALKKGQIVHGNGAATEDRIPVAVPIKIRGTVIGVLDTYKTQDEGEWTPDELEILEELAEQLGIALDSARLFERTQRRAQQEQMIAEITARIRSSMDPETILQTAVRELGSALGSDRTFIRLGAQIEPPEER
jgi:GAF domain-containing protein/HAMP domain-containing protein